MRQRLLESDAILFGVEFGGFEAGDLLQIVEGLEVAVFAAISDPCLELQLSLPTFYRRTVWRRVLLALAWIVTLCTPEPTFSRMKL